MATHKKPAGKSIKNAKVSAKPAKKATPAKKVVASNKKGTPAKKAAPAKAVVKKAAPAKKIETKKAAPAKAAPAKANSNKGKTVSKANDKAQAKKSTAPAKKAVPAPAKKATPAAKKAAPAPKKAAPAPVKKAAAAKPAPAAKKAEVKKAAPAKAEVKKAAPVAKAAPSPKVEVKKSAPVAKAQEAPMKGSPADKAPVKKGKAAKAPVKKIIVQTITHTSSRPMPNRQTVREEKKPTVVIAHRRLENKSKGKDNTKTMVSYQPETYRSILDEPQQQTGPVYRYSDEELNEFKELISGRLEAARKELVYLQGLITRKDEAGTEDTENRYMNMEDGSGAMEREQLAQLASRQIQFINHLEKAIMRIENKTYGICRVTGKLIDKARLRAVPHATLSIEAKNTMTKK